MIPLTSDVKQIDNLPGEEIEFSIGENDQKWVMRSLADLYSDTTMATIRELATNAYDAAHERALRLGIDTPAIEVSLPSELNPFFTIRDQGDGMSRDILKKVYTKFGTSTKRGSNEFNGLLGFGSKAPLAYTTSMTINTINNGVKVSAVALRKEDYSLTLKMLAEARSSAESGTEIIIPVHNIDEFNQKAQDFFQYWLPGQVLINGSEPEHAVGREIVENLYYAAGGSSYVVMGRVPYRIHSPWFLFDGSGFRNFNFVLYVENGDVEFTPSREDLKYTERTKNNLKAVFKSLGDKMMESAIADVAAAETHAEAFERYQVWRQIAGYGNDFSVIKYKGESIPDCIDQNHTSWLVHASRYSTRFEKGFALSVKDLLVVNHTGQVNARQKAIVRNYMQKSNNFYKRVLFISGDFNSDWIDDKNIVQWADLKAMMPKSTRKKSASSMKYEYWDEDGHNKDTLPDVKNLFYVSVRTAKMYNIRKAIQHLEKHHDFEDFAVVILSENRIQKFQRENKATNFTDFAKKFVVTDIAKLYTDVDRERLGITNSRWLEWLEADRIVDPVLKSKIELLRDYETNENVQRNQDLADLLGLGYYLNDEVNATERYDVTEHYPLLRVLNFYNRHEVMEEVYTYINSKYESRKDIND